MRRKDREVTDKGEILSILQKCRVCRLGMADGPRPYVVPLSFGVEEEGDGFTLYMHSAKEGRKLAIMERRPAVCVEVDCEYVPIEAGDNPCAYGCNFASVIGEGKAEILESLEEKAHGLAVLMRHQTGRDFAFTPAQTESVAVIRVRLQTVTAKRRG